MVTIESWAYSDYSCRSIVVSWNTYEEAKNAVKIYYQENNDDEWNQWLVFSDWECWQYRWEPWNSEESDYCSPFETSYGFWEEVRMERLSVVYDGWEVAKESLHILKDNQD